VRVAETVEKFCACHGVPANAVFQINLAIDELLTNTISYGFPDGEPHEIIVELAWQGEDIVIDLIDDGIAFNPLEAPEPDLDAPLEERKVGGLGVYFVKTMMSAVTYSRQDNRNRLHLRKCFGSNA
jgi:anti-sigma regulatory factor (Ser/Thr protein kinase)